MGAVVDSGRAANETFNYACSSSVQPPVDAPRHAWSTHARAAESRPAVPARLEAAVSARMATSKPAAAGENG